MVKAVILLAALAAIFLFLYDRGYMVINAKSAASFIGSPKGTGASFTSCNGYTKRIVRFQADGTYTFILNADLSKGSISVELQNAEKQRVMLLNCTNTSASVTIEKKEKYYLITKFKSATGRYSLIRE
ncbi:MAG: hypothetical protein E7451_07985 [Ruminococcaceae bacterium]|nr:hypothetical protein [Oscillospiraceae bacterium]